MNDPGPLPSVLEQLVAAEKSTLPAPEGARKQVLDRLVATHGEAALASTGALAGSTAGKAVAVKLLVLVGLAGSSFGAGYWTGYQRREVVMVPRSPAIVAVATAEPSPPPASAPAAVPAQVPAAKPALNDAPDASVSPTSPRARHVARPTLADAGVASITSALQRGRENNLLRTAWEALEDKDFDLALQTLAIHASEFPDGLLAEEREALWVRVLVNAGRDDEARERAAEFHHRYPASIHRRKVDRAIEQIPKQEPGPADKN